MKKKIIRTALALAICILALCSAANANQQGAVKYGMTKENLDNTEAIFEGLKAYYSGFDFVDRVKQSEWCAHMGYSNLAPANTAPAFMLAGLCGAKLCEGDVHISKDGGLFMCHDASLKEVTGDCKAIRDLTSNEIMEKTITKLNNIANFKGLKICSFSDYLHICKDYGMLAQIDLKLSDETPEAVRKAGIRNLWTEICRQGMQKNVIVASLWYIGLEEFRAVDPTGEVCIAPLRASDGSNKAEVNKILNTAKLKPNVETGVSAWTKQTCCKTYPQTAGIAQMKPGFLIKTGEQAAKTANLKPTGKMIDAASISPIPDCEYDGTEQKPVPTVNLNGIDLKQGTDFGVSYRNNEKAGEASMIVYGKGKYNGSILTTFKIKKRLISKTKPTFSEKEIYNGKPHKPNPELSLNGTVLQKGTDYEIVSYSNNTNAGTASIRIKGKGNFDGTADLKFTVYRASVSNGKAKIEAIPDETYSGKDSKPTPNPTITREGRTLKKGTDYTLEYKYESEEKTAGTAWVTITGEGNYTGTITKPFTILPMSLEDESIEASITPKVTYNGKERRPTPKVVLNGRTLLINRDFKVEYKNNKEVGKATATVIGQGNFTGKKVLTFKIE